MNEININSKDVEPPQNISKIISFCNKVLKKLKIDNWEVSILFCNDEFIRNLNKKYRNKDYPTDILSFTQDEIDNKIEIHIAGDIIISMNTLSTNAVKYNVVREEELKRILIHGLLHLKGLEHTENNQKMIKLQESILESLKKESMF